MSFLDPAQQAQQAQQDKQLADNATARSIFSGFASKFGISVGGILDPSNARLSLTNLIKGGTQPKAKTAETRVNVSSPGLPNDDWRIKVSVGQNSGIFYQATDDAGILNPLRSTKGVIFPYTPTISTSFSAGYTSQKLTHSNYPAYFYEASETAAISITGDFTVQNVTDGQYLLACIYFFRAATKMFYGSGAHTGNPPPMLFLDGYGKYYFPHVPCVLTSFTHTMPNEVDYIQIPGTNTSVPPAPNVVQDPQQRAATLALTAATLPPVTRVPTASSIQILLQPVYSRRSVREFDLEQFAQGKLLSRGFL